MKQVTVKLPTAKDYPWEHCDGNRQWSTSSKLWHDEGNPLRYYLYKISGSYYLMFEGTIMGKLSGYAFRREAANVIACEEGAEIAQMALHRPGVKKLSKT